MLHRFELSFLLRWTLIALHAPVVLAQSDADERLERPAAGITWSAAYTGEAFAGVRGGLARDAAYLHNIDLVATVDFRTLRRGGPRLYAHVLGNHGGDPSTFIGDAQVVSNISADDAWRLFELWVETTAFRDHVSVLLGLYDLNSEFDVTETGGFFVNSSFGIGAEFGSSGHHGPSIFPTTGLALRVRWMPLDLLSLQLGLFEAIPGDPSRPRRTLVRLSPDEGALIVVQVGLRTDPIVADPVSRDALRHALLSRTEAPPSARAFAFGLWHYTGDFERWDDLDRFKGGSTGIYLLAEQELPVPNGLGTAARCFVRSGWADPTVNRFVGSISGGCVAEGFLRTRLDQQIGLATTTAINGNRYSDALMPDVPLSRTETVFELGYAVAFSSYLGVQTTMQYILNPNTRRDVPDALAVGLRLLLSM